MTEADIILQTLSADETPGTARELLRKISKITDGHTHGDMLRVCCFLLWSVVRDTEPEDRPALLSAIMRMIDPSKGRG